MSTPATPPSGPDAARTGAQPAPAMAAPPSGPSVVAQQRQRFGGMKFGSCFFGWLAATGLAVLLISLAGAVGLSLGQGMDLAPADASGQVTPIGIGGAIALLVVIFVSYWAGGYVAGRMARFSGAKQGVGVWLWAIVVTVVTAVIGAIAGTRTEVWRRLEGLPPATVNADSLSTVGVLTVIGIAVVSLIGAVLGGLSGMHYHRKIDKTGSDVNLTKPTVAR